MTLAVNDTDHRRWRDRIEGLVDEWRTVDDDDVVDLTVDEKAKRSPSRR